jgi:hypothetical protein
LHITVIDIDAPRRANGPSRRARLCGALAVVVFAAGVAAVFTVAPGHAPTPAEQLARMSKLVSAAGTAHFTSDDTWDSGPGDGQPGSHYRDTSRTEGVLALPDRSHWTEDYGDGADEAIVTAEAVFTRHADSKAALAGEQWVKEPSESQRPQAHAVDLTGGDTPSQAASIVRAFGAPSDIAELLAHMKALTRVNPNVIRGTLDVASLPDLQIGGEPLPWVRVELTSDDTGRLARMVFTMTGNDPQNPSTGRSDVRFSGWGAPVEIQVPTPAEVDPTPNIDETGLAGFTATPIVAPGNLPASFQLVEAHVVKGNTADGTCPEVDLTYGDPTVLAADDAAAAARKDDNPVVRDLEVSLTPDSCDQYDAGAGRPATLGGHQARIDHGNVADGDSAVSLDTLVGSTHLHVDSDLPDAQVVSAFRTIAPFNLATQRVYNGPSPWGA